jgi:hypothetical protein
VPTLRLAALITCPLEPGYRKSSNLASFGAASVCAKARSLRQAFRLKKQPSEAGILSNEFAHCKSETKKKTGRFLSAENIVLIFETAYL